MSFRCLAFLFAAFLLFAPLPSGAAPASLPSPEGGSGAPSVVTEFLAEHCLPASGSAPAGVQSWRNSLRFLSRPLRTAALARAADPSRGDLFGGCVPGNGPRFGAVVEHIRLSPGVFEAAFTSGSGQAWFHLATRGPGGRLLQREAFSADLSWKFVLRSEAPSAAPRAVFRITELSVMPDPAWLGSWDLSVPGTALHSGDDSPSIEIIAGPAGRCEVSLPGVVPSEQPFRTFAEWPDGSAQAVRFPPVRGPRGVVLRHALRPGDPGYGHFFSRLSLASGFLFHGAWYPLQGTGAVLWELGCAIAPSGAVPRSP